MGITFGLARNDSSSSSSSSNTTTTALRQQQQQQQAAAAATPRKSVRTQKWRCIQQHPVTHQGPPKQLQLQAVKPAPARGPPGWVSMSRKAEACKTSSRSFLLRGRMYKPCASSRQRPQSHICDCILTSRQLEGTQADNT